MLQLPTGREASRGERAPQYQRHRPEQTLLYQLIEEYYPAFEAQWAVEGRVLPDYVRQEFDEYLKCGRYEHGFLRVQRETCHIAKLAALVPKPRVNLTRFHGVFAPNSKHRALVTPAKRGKGGKPKDADGQDERAPVRRHAAMTWAQRLNRVFNIDVEKCQICGGTAKVIACIEDPVVIKMILAHIDAQAPRPGESVLPDSRAPP